MMIARARTATCTICGKETVSYRHDWLFRCQACGFLSSILDLHVNSSDLQINEQRREKALHGLRRKNFETILDRLAEAGLERPASILDVGCGHGWFLTSAAARGHESVGIEPDAVVAAMAEANGVSVRVGFFPNVVRPGETFDAIVFNDVFEHLPDLSVAMSEIGRILAPNGLLVINLPLATGVFYRIADTLDRMGYHGPFERMWQLDFPSPHRSYFSQNQLSEIARRYGFEECARYSLPSLRVDGLWERLRYDPNQSVFSAAAMWPLLALATPVLRFLPPDIGVQIFRRPGRNTP